MGKAKPGQNKGIKNAKQQLHTIKNGSVKKDKNLKFKNTPAGKVALINNSKAPNKNVSPQKNFQKDTGIKNNQNLSKNNAKQLKQNSAKNKQSPSTAQNKPANKKTNLKPTKELEEVDDSDSDIDEDIILQEDVSLNETFEDEEESDTDIPDIFGQSLQDESDEDDEDFEEEEEEDDYDNDIKREMVEHKSIKVLKGVKPKAKDNEDNKNKNDENKKLHQVAMEDDEDDDDDEDEEDEENENSDLHIFEENLEDESNEDDEDFEEEEEEDDDDDDDSDEDDNIKRETLVCKGVKMFKGVQPQVENSEEDDEEGDNDEDEDEDEDDDDDDNDNDDENEDSTLGLKALLGNSIADEDDDEDFNEEDEDDEDDDISDEDEDGEENDNVVKITKEKGVKASNSKDIPKEQRQVREGEKKLSSEEQEEIDKRTIFIDNIPKETKETEVRKVFSKFGPINNLRFRGIIPQDTKMSKKVAAITKQIHPKVTTVVVYINYKSQESAQKALSMNGKIFEGNYIHVKIVDKPEKKEWDRKKAVFIGNLKFGIDKNIIWKHFSTCGEIDSVHLVRDKQTGQTKGFGYVNFKTEDSAVLALKLDGVEIMNRPVRVKAYVSGDNKKGEKRVSSNNDGNPRKKFKNNLEKPVACKNENEANIKKHKKSQKNNAKSGEQKLISFLGQKADSKNKKKENKLDKKKKQMAKKLTAQSNKPVKV